MTRDGEGTANKLREESSAASGLMCPKCPAGTRKTWKRPYNLATHIRAVHNKERPHECPDCHKTFSRNLRGAEPNPSLE
ncbi:hypothetical protein TRAPUB_1171 [Trametes pubescens]|uniref:C2H2-type domain-containing protein n=1 Tax=Trametes pubescens TaxID=154538 RepID=A0A1M2VK64_TRAPU|nr:hypothetical protein TRAPUB_1171 [Trametes pubescens]